MSSNKKKSDSPITLEGVFLQGVRFHKHGVFRKLWKLQAMFRHAAGSWLKRRRVQRREGFTAPIAIAFSPTMRCNLSCVGCYALDYPRDNELSLEAIDDMLGSAERMGVFLFIITGGEPLLRQGILEVLRRHRRLLFLMITNGILMNDKTARMIASAGNIVTVVSVEGSREQTDARRGEGMYDRVKRAMKDLNDADAVFGFSAMVTRENFGTLSGDEFIDEMVDSGCALGFYTEYIPIGSAARWEMVLEDAERAEFRERVLNIRRSKPIMVAHLPEDEYGPDKRCMAIDSGCVHINSQGGVEPCPFTHFASDNIREKTLAEVLRSDFIARIRSSDAPIRCGRLGCALFENREIVEKIAASTGAKRTDVEHTIL